jgi:hypothetical protein
MVLVKDFGVAESGYETISGSLEALSRIRRNHSTIQQRQDFLKDLWAVRPF